MTPARKISPATVRADFNDLLAVMHYTKAAHALGLWASERQLIEKYFPNRNTPLLEAGCGAGRVAIALWELGHRNITAFDFAEELVDQARSLAAERHADGPTGIIFLHADATNLKISPSQNRDSPIVPASSPKPICHLLDDKQFGGAVFLFNGLMQIPGRKNRRAALRELRRVCTAGAYFIFTTHDRDWSPMEKALWRLEALRWKRGEQDPRLVEFGDRYFQDETGRTFMHLPNRAEILADLKATGWAHEFDALRRELATETRAVLDFSDECRFWVAQKRE